MLLRINQAILEDGQVKKKQGGGAKKEPKTQARMKTLSPHRNITMKTNKGLWKASKTKLGSSERCI